MLVLVGLLLAAMVSIYFTTYETMFLREKSAATGSLETYGIAPFSCEHKASEGGGNKGLEEAEIGPTAHQEQSIRILPRPYFPLLGSTQIATHANSITKKSASVSECYDDCRHFVPDAGHCLLSAATMHDLLIANRRTNTDTNANPNAANANIQSSRKIDNSEYVGMRCLPSFLIVGAMKAGTGVLMSALNQHPLLMSGHGAGGKNEVHFFGSAAAKAISSKSKHSRDAAAVATPPAGSARSASSAHTTKANAATATSDPSRNCPWVHYALHFPQSKNIYTFDKSPDILRVPVAQEQMAALLPSAKLLVLLRDPSTRAISAFDHHCRHDRYVKLSRPLCLRALSPGTGTGTGTGTEQVSFPAGTIVRLDWFVESAQNIKLSVQEKTAHSRVFGLAHQYSPLGEVPGCLVLSACDESNEKLDTSLRRNSSGTTAQSACPVTSFTSLKRYYTQLQYPCTAADIKNYYYGTGSAERKSHSSAELAHGMYAEQLKSLLRYYPAAQIQVLFQENMLLDTRSVLDSVQGFLGIPRYDLVMEGATHGLSLRGGNDDVQEKMTKSMALVAEMKKLIGSVFLTVRKVWRNTVSKRWGDANTSDENVDVDASLSSSARLQASLPPATRALLAGSYALANRDLAALLQALPEVAHYSGRELPSKWTA